MSRVTSNTDVFADTTSAVTVTVPGVEGRSRYTSVEVFGDGLLCPIAPEHADGSCA